MTKPPVMVTGLPRSGTSWTGKMLAAGGELIYVNEPLNPQHPPGGCPGVLRASVTHRFQYICDDNAEQWLAAFRDTTALRYGFLAELRQNRSPYDLARLLRYGTSFTYGRLTGRRALLDDPFAVLSAAWFAKALGCRVIVLIRDPISFVGSWMRLGWTVYFHELLEQPLLVRDHPAVEDLRPLIGSQDRLAKAAALWRVTRSILNTFDNVLLTSYNDLAASPIPEFKRLYDYADLLWTPQAERQILHSCTAAAPTSQTFSWSGLSRTAYTPMNSRQSLSTYRTRLTDPEITRIRTLTTT